MKKNLPPKATITEEILQQSEESPSVAPTEPAAGVPSQPPTEAIHLANPQAEAALTEANDKYLRLYSDFENFKKRVAKEKLTLIETASERLLKKLLPIVDDFNRALDALQQKNAASTATQDGIQLIYDKLIYLLHQEGLQPMPLEPGAEFDAELHEAVTQTPVQEPSMQGKVVDIVEKGYLLKERVLRFAKVVIGV